MKGAEMSHKPDNAGGITALENAGPGDGRETFTPGPWRVVYYDCGDRHYYDHNGPCPSVQAPEDEDCAIVHWDGFKQKYWSSANGDQRQIEANAHLIAAAPDLLAALETLLDHYTALVNCGDCGNWNPESEPEVITARATIAKARGAA
jgi:hypothetical protein